MIHFDARTTMSRGKDPLKKIVHQFRQMGENEVMCVISSFIPVTLIHLFEKGAESVLTEKISSLEFHTYFRKSGCRCRPQRQDDLGFGEACVGYLKRMEQMDVNECKTPLLLHRVLEYLESLTPGSVLYIRDKRIPLLLLDELAEQSYEVHVCSRPEKDVRLLIIKK